LFSNPRTEDLQPGRCHRNPSVHSSPTLPPSLISISVSFLLFLVKRNHVLVTGAAQSYTQLPRFWQQPLERAFSCSCVFCCVFVLWFCFGGVWFFFFFCLFCFVFLVFCWFFLCVFWFFFVLFFLCVLVFCLFFWFFFGLFVCFFLVVCFCVFDCFMSRLQLLYTYLTVQTRCNFSRCF
jgi:hypothetical protein